MHPQQEIRGGMTTILVVLFAFALLSVLGDAFQWVLSRIESGASKVSRQRDQWRERAEKREKLRIPRTAVVASTPEPNLNELTGLDFESHVAELLYKAGFSDVRRTPFTNDQGADLLAKKAGSLVVIQVKRYKGPVGNRAVQEVAAALRFYDGQEAWVVTNSTFTPAADKLAKKNRSAPV